jgi:hypothetical protein
MVRRPSHISIAPSPPPHPLTVRHAHAHNTRVGSTFPLRLSLPLTKRRRVHLALLPCARVGATARIARLAATATTTARRRAVLQASSGLSLLVLVGGRPGNKSVVNTVFTLDVDELQEGTSASMHVYDNRTYMWASMHHAQSLH